MKKLRNSLVIVFLLLHFGLFSQSGDNVICRQGQVSFFSYTSVEDIEATNNQVVSIINRQNGEIGVRMLMNTFVFKKALMEEHFNESYVESDIYPELQFLGKINDFDASTAGEQTRLIKGEMNFHGVKKEIEIKTKMDNVDGNLVLSGDFEVGVSDYNIKVPLLLAPNIAKIIKVKFRFEYGQHESN